MFSGLSPAGHLLSLGPPPPPVLLIYNQADSSEWGCMAADGGSEDTSA